MLDMVVYIAMMFHVIRKRRRSRNRIVIIVIIAPLLLLVLLTTIRPSSEGVVVAFAVAAAMAMAFTNGQQQERTRIKACKSYSSSSLDDTLSTAAQQHKHARKVRIEMGHEKAQPLYERLLLVSHNNVDENNNSSNNNNNNNSRPKTRPRPRRKVLLLDATTATHLAACKESPHLLLSIGRHNMDDELFSLRMHQLRQFLIASQFTCQEIEKQFIIGQLGINSNKILSFLQEQQQTNNNIYASCPALYLKPAMAGSVFMYVNDENDDDADDAENGYDTTTIEMARRVKTIPKIQNPVQCLVALFLLGLALPRSIVNTFIDTKHLHLLQNLNLITISSSLRNNIASMVFANVQIFPIHLFGVYNDMYIITDWHPNVLSSTSIVGIGRNENKNENKEQQQQQQYEEESPVMYIGPDSLALVQHLPITTTSSNNNDNDDDDNNKESYVNGGGGYTYNNKHVLDLCTGSGIQAIAYLLRHQQNDGRRQDHSSCHATCVDISERALRFTRMNAMLNGIDVTKQLTLIQGNLLDGHGRLFYYNSGGDDGGGSSSRRTNVNTDTNSSSERKPLLDLILQQQQDQQHHHCPVDMLITANPPFLPVPPAIVDARHGFFSAGGPTGEDVLKQIIRLTSQIFMANNHHHCNNNNNNSSGNGRLAVVSEFFLQEEKKKNAPKSGGTTDVSLDDDDNVCTNVFASSDSLLHRIQEWWSDNGNDNKNMDYNDKNLTNDVTTNTKGKAATNSNNKARGLLFTNQFPIDAATYALRRADDAQEADIWLHHLQNHKIEFASPGLLFVQQQGVWIGQEQEHEDQQKETALCDDTDENQNLVLRHEIVPRSAQYGSIWTPSNPHAAAFTRHVLDKYLGWCDDDDDDDEAI